MRDEQFQRDGFKIVPDILSDFEIEELSSLCETANGNSAGSRNFLLSDRMRQLAKEIASHNLLQPLLPRAAVAVQCSYFKKDPSVNWLVGLHRDKFIPVRRKFDSPGWTSWSVKEGVHFVQPPHEVLESLVAVRLHFDDTSSENGALQLIPGSHCSEEAKHRITSEVSRGGALAFHPLVQHASSKILNGMQRRVLHLLFGPPKLPDPAVWAYAV